MCGPVTKLTYKLGLDEYNQSLYGGNVFINVTKDPSQNQILVKTVKKKFISLNLTGQDLEMVADCVPIEQTNKMRNAFGIIFYSMLSSQNHLMFGLMVYETLRQKEENIASKGKHTNLTPGLMWLATGYLLPISAILVRYSFGGGDADPRKSAQDYSVLAFIKGMTGTGIVAQLLNLILFAKIRKIYGLQFTYLGGVKVCGYFKHLDVRLWLFLLFTYTTGAAGAEGHFSFANWMIEKGPCAITIVAVILHGLASVFISGLA